ncbi:hypothetical protein Lal_00027640 [Lupinus albus]|nr:hypothetical protein Lal_00027640 [Lupinus albus]
MEKLNTSVDASTTSWLTDLEIEDYNLFPEYHLSLLNVDDIEFLSHDIPSSLHSDEMSLERPTKQLKTNSWNSSNITQHFSPDLSSSSPPTTTTTTTTTTTSHILYFENSNSSHVNTNTLNPEQNDLVSVSQKLTQTRKGTSENQSKGTKRSSSHGHDHIIAERKRRENLSQSLIALAALIPGLKKMDKASVLGDAIKYMKDLKERLRLLEEESHKRVVESVVIARVSDNEVLLRIHCIKQKGILVKLLDHIQKLQLFVVNSTVLPFGKNSIIDITIVAKVNKIMDKLVLRLFTIIFFM